MKDDEFMNKSNPKIYLQTPGWVVSGLVLFCPDLMYGQSSVGYEDECRRLSDGKRILTSNLNSLTRSAYNVRYDCRRGGTKVHTRE